MVESRIHRMLARTLAVVVLVSAPLLGWSHAFYLALGVIFGELWLSPDLDLSPICTPYQWWPWPIRLPWRLYSRLLRHRSPLSHWPILGTSGRLLFCCGPGAAIAYALGWDPASVSPEAIEVAAVFVAGIEASAWLHLVADLS